MNDHAKFDAASFILGEEIRNRTKKQTDRQTDKQTKNTLNNTSTRCLSACADKKFIDVSMRILFSVYDKDDYIEHYVCMYYDIMLFNFNLRQIYLPISFTHMHKYS